MSTTSRVKTICVGAGNLLAILAVAGFLSHTYKSNGTSNSANVSAVVDSSDIDTSFFNSERFKRRQTKALPSKADVDGARQLMMGNGKGMKKKKANNGGSKGKGKGNFLDEPDCIPLFPTPAPTKGKGKGKGMMNGGKMKGRGLASGMEFSGGERKLPYKSSSGKGKGSKGYYYNPSSAPVSSGVRQILQIFVLDLLPYTSHI